METNGKDIYVLGTGLSHDGSACLLKNGKIVVAIEKERITRRKHDGFNDTDAITYCLNEQGITLDDISLVVQNANAGSFKFGNSYFGGERLFRDDLSIPVVTISHHLAHAYYAIGSSPFQETAVLVLDGRGSPYDDCMDFQEGVVQPEAIPDDIQHLYSEKDSFYIYKDNRLTTIYKDFSPDGLKTKNYPMHPYSNKHSIGGLYSAVAAYCFRDDSDTGKLMGLAPYGRPETYADEIFNFQDGRVFVNYDWMQKFNRPSRSEQDLWDNFQYYADIAYWVQKETERAILYTIQARSELTNVKNLSYTGGVALNAVANEKVLKQGLFEKFYFTPAAGDNGLAIGCAYYGWLEVLKRERVIHDGKSNFGKVYSEAKIEEAIKIFSVRDKNACLQFIKLFFDQIGNFVNKAAVKRSEYMVRFIIAEVGVINVSLRNGAVSVSTTNFQEPHCTITTDANTFVSGFVDRSNFVSSISEKKTIVVGDYLYLLSAFKLDELVASVQELNHDHPNKITYSVEHDVIKRAAQLLASGRVIAWFQGGCEFGPRALGFRSILADPRKTGIQKFINNKIKFREDFRPFAPAVLREEVSNYFDFDGDSPYMIMVSQVKKEVASEIPGVVHVDNSARIQTVTQDSNERFYRLIKEFYDITGVPILINTSFNKRGMPLIETPTQAITYFFECALDCLVIGNFIVYKE